MLLNKSLLRVPGNAASLNDHAAQMRVFGFGNTGVAGYGLPLICSGGTIPSCATVVLDVSRCLSVS
jgi:hypothetical protein